MPPGFLPLAGATQKWARTDHRQPRPQGLALRREDKTFATANVRLLPEGISASTPAVLLRAAPASSTLAGPRNSQAAWEGRPLHSGTHRQVAFASQPSRCFAEARRRLLSRPARACRAAAPRHFNSTLGWPTAKSGKRKRTSSKQQRDNRHAFSAGPVSFGLAPSGVGSKALGAAFRRPLPSGPLPLTAWAATLLCFACALPGLLRTSFAALPSAAGAAFSMPPGGARADGSRPTQTGLVGAAGRRRLARGLALEPPRALALVPLRAPSRRHPPGRRGRPLPAQTPTTQPPSSLIGSWNFAGWQLRTGRRNLGAPSSCLPPGTSSWPKTRRAGPTPASSTWTASFWPAAPACVRLSDGSSKSRGRILFA
eukprot:GHVT01049666.1.p1 GENE.GHVT01049666.1~~GHVT01049666.1.p1  ORF type:complete len:369 (+),score=53.48 GHVT01049666.1:333-1439(+)